MNKSQSKYFKTAILMDEALIDLLNKKRIAPELPYITIKEIFAKTGVNRSTFYLHYETMNDLIRETTEYIDSKFINSFNYPPNFTTIEINNASLNELLFVTNEYLIPYLFNSLILSSPCTPLRILNGLFFDQNFLHS